jgi:hypothetical protein
LPASPWRTWLLLPFRVYGLFIFVNLVGDDVGGPGLAER